MHEKLKFLLITLIFSQFALVSSEIKASDDSPEARRLLSYRSPEKYLNKNFEQKILVVGGGLTYDDLVVGKENEVLPGNMDIKKRRAYFPENAYLVDYDGDLNYYGELYDVPSYSDLQANITLPIGTEGNTGPERGLPEEFLGQFDVIILENLSYDALTPNAFQNIWTLLRPGGQLICNNYLSTTTLTITQEDLSNNSKFLKFTITDSTGNEIIVFYNRQGILNFEESPFLLYSDDPLVIAYIAQNAQRSDYIHQIYQNIFLNEEYLDFVTQFFRNNFINASDLEILTDTPFWYGVPENYGYLTWIKPQN